MDLVTATTADPNPDGDLADRLDVPVWKTNALGASIYFNDAWLRLRGTTRAEELERGWLAGVHPDDLHACLAAFSSALLRQAAFDLSFRLIGARGEPRNVQLTARPIFANEGRFTGFVGTLTEVTMRPPATDDGILEGLPRRQRQVLELIAAGMDNLKISAHLGIAERTVKAHVTALYRKLRCEHRTQLALWAIARGVGAPQQSAASSGDATTPSES